MNDHRIYHIVKRMMDVGLAFLAVVFLCPVFLILSIWIKLDSPGPVFFRQKRVGIHQTHFEILKFRTMRLDTPKNMPTHLLKNPDQYITKSGRFLRKTSLDELPQLFNIIKGDMSIVGPRPALWNQYDLLKEREKYGANDILPGLTGWAQVNGRDTVSIREKAELDGYYVSHQGLGMDVRCLFRTALSVIKQDGVQEGGMDENDRETGKPSADQPLVSVIVATYRREQELKRALISLAAQTYPNLEVVLVDDNGDDVWNDKVEMIIKSMKRCSHLSVLYIKNKENRGSAGSRNAGIKAASGDYITFLDDDDKYLPKKVEHQLQFMVEKDLDYCITDLALYNEQGKLAEVRQRYYLKKNKETQEWDRLLVYHLLYHMTGTDTLMFRKSYLEEIGGFPPIDVGDEFYLMEQAIIHGGKFGYLPRCEVKALVHSRTEGLSSSNSKIEGENTLYRFKRRYFPRLKRKEIRHIRMRHHLVLAYAYLRKREWKNSLREGILAVGMAPFLCIRMVIRNKK